MSEAMLDKQRVAESFSRAAATYDHAAAFQRSAGNNLLARLPGDMRPNDIVDLGAGTGYFTRALAQRFAVPVVGLDLAEGMLRFARQCSGPEILNTHPRWVVADAEALPLRTGSQDLIFSSLAVQWCPDLACVLRDAWRAIRPGGCLAFNTLVDGTLFELQRAWQAVDGFVHVNRFMPENALRDLLGAAGFGSWHCEMETHVLHYAQLAELTRELKALGAHNLNVGRPGGLTGRTRLRALTQAYDTFRQTKGLPATYQVAQVLMFKEL
tara:strand:- start:33414 stop:34217 length:804 start_codon:yes stop_codon:yes gene_type:complete